MIYCQTVTHEHMSNPEPFDSLYDVIVMFYGYYDAEVYTELNTLIHRGNYVTHQVNRDLVIILSRHAPPGIL